MKRFVLYAIFIGSLITSSCTIKQQEEKKKPQTKIAKGGKVYGGEISFYTIEQVNTFFPLSSISMYNQRAISPVFETLLKYDLIRKSTFIIKVKVWFYLQLLSVKNIIIPSQEFLL